MVATYREHRHAIARGVAMGAVMAEMYGKADDRSRGISANDFHQG